MTLGNLDNLIKTGKLKKELPDQNEFAGMLNSAKSRLQDAQIEGLSEASQFSLAYSASHALALAAMRWHGYRTRERYLVFQCLEHTVGLAKEKWLVLDKCHKQRNLAEYEGQLDISSQLLHELIEITTELLKPVESLGPVKVDSL
ncbi:MAG: hypothetical protein OEY52_12895 [Gammaproteobacteria bacterium]|nr:hypothetical protein [Gammaproteobacteria bacterium]